MYMQQFLTEAIPDVHQRAVLEAISRQRGRLLHNNWGHIPRNGGDPQGCPEVVAAFAAINEPIDVWRVWSKYEPNAENPHHKIEAMLAEMLGVQPEQAHKAWQSWDNATRSERKLCIKACERALAKIRFGDQDRVTAFERAQIMAGALAPAVVTMAVLALK